MQPMNNCFSETQGLLLWIDHSVRRKSSNSKMGAEKTDMTEGLTDHIRTINQSNELRVTVNKINIRFPTSCTGSRFDYCRNDFKFGLLITLELA